MAKIVQIKYLIFCLSALFINVGNAFELYISTGYTDPPDFSKYGFNSTQIIYEQQVYNVGEDRNIFNTSHLEKIISLVKRNKSSNVILDFEYWMKNWASINYKQKTQILNRYVNIISEMHSVLPEHKFGYYRVVPAWSHWDIVRSSRLVDKWEKENVARQVVGDAVDVFYPALYTYNSDPEDWKLRATMAVTKARQMSAGKKVIAFIWPAYHHSAKARKQGKKRLPPEYWRFQMEHLKTIADGFIIWDGALGSKGKWRDDMPWWIETKRFLEKHFPEKQSANINQSL